MRNCCNGLGEILVHVRASGGDVFQEENIMSTENGRGPTWMNHGGKRIIFVDYSHMSGPELVDLIKKARAEIIAATIFTWILLKSRKRSGMHGLG